MTLTPQSLARYSLFIALWLLVWRLSVLMEYQPHASLWFPPAGLSFAAFLLLGWRALLPVFIASFLSTLWMYWLDSNIVSIQQQMTSAIWFGFAHIIAYGFGGTLCGYFLQREQRQNFPKQIYIFLLFGGATTLLATFSGIIALHLADPQLQINFMTTWLPWWIGDLAGTFVMAPIFIIVIMKIWPQLTDWTGIYQQTKAPKVTSKNQFVVKLLVLQLLLAVVMIADNSLANPALAFAVFFLSLPQMWIVYSESSWRAIVSLALTSLAIALWVGLLGMSDSAITYQFALCVIAANAYFGMAVPNLAQQNQVLYQQNITDGLTGIITRQHFIECTEKVLKRQILNRQPVSLLIFDLDHFKTINDTYGHSIGDEALVSAAQAIKKLIREGDLVGRFGGDEFLVLLPNQNLSEAEATAQRLKRDLPTIEVNGLQLPLTASFGVIEFQAHEQVQQALIRADDALRRAKHLGRNKVATAP
ncbi:sensor domain-containing diguanylate cyclase [Pseudidiomarina aestuarii]|uniref:diguanylate cyclase n=1 Tax=Pseudidiomarina aestuarii TaxID=624146 RepID=A0A7Z7EUX8_9GAMM|nr:diguanylate cyclase [Pseudidiomarina aestuarii]RUO42174.1 sensor domain-containing diguanylate cyclase [Pseudidiomarina aestuarii]